MNKTEAAAIFEVLERDFGIELDREDKRRWYESCLFDVDPATGESVLEFFRATSADGLSPARWNAVRRQLENPVPAGEQDAIKAHIAAARLAIENAPVPRRRVA